MSFVKLTEDWIKLIDIAKLNYGEVILLCKIVTLSENKDKVCTASNDYFARLMCTTERSIQRYIKELKDAEVIKTFEQKEGMKTTTRFIYLQLNKINELIKEYDKKHGLTHDRIVTCSNEGHDNFGNSTRQFWSEDTTDLSLAHDSSVTQIREENREKENKKNNGANAPKVASLPTANAVPERWIPKDNISNDIFDSKIHSDTRVIEILKQEHENYPHESADYLSNMPCFYDSNKEIIREYVESVLGIK